jgi:hypothetical protein
MEQIGLRRKAKMGFDLSVLDTVTRAEEGVEFEVSSPKTGKGVGLFITIKGVDSKLYQATLKEVMKKATEKTTQADIKESLVVACASGWRAVDRTVNAAGEVVETATDVTLGGKPMKFSEAALREAFVLQPTIRDQAIAFQADRAHFLPVASAN